MLGSPNAAGDDSPNHKSPVPPFTSVLTGMRAVPLIVVSFFTSPSVTVNFVSMFKVHYWPQYQSQGHSAFAADDMIVKIANAPAWIPCMNAPFCSKDAIGAQCKIRRKCAHRNSGLLRI